MKLLLNIFALAVGAIAAVVASWSGVAGTKRICFIILSLLGFCSATAVLTYDHFEADRAQAEKTLNLTRSVTPITDIDFTATFDVVDGDNAVQSYLKRLDTEPVWTTAAATGDLAAVGIPVNTPLTPKTEGEEAPFMKTLLASAMRLTVYDSKRGVKDPPLLVLSMNIDHDLRIVIRPRDKALRVRLKCRQPNFISRAQTARSLVDLCGTVWELQFERALWADVESKFRPLLVECEIGSRGVVLPMFPDKRADNGTSWGTSCGGTAWTSFSDQRFAAEDDWAADSNGVIMTIENKDSREDLEDAIVGLRKRFPIDIGAAASSPH